MLGHFKTYVLGFSVILILLGIITFISTGCGNSYGTPYSYSNLIPNDAGIVVKMINTTSISGGLHSPKLLALNYDIDATTNTLGTLIKVRPDDVYVSISDMSIYSTDGKEYVLFTEPKEINLLNLIKDGEVVAMAYDVPAATYNRMKFNINYMRILYEGDKQRIALDQTVYLSTADANFTQFTLQSSTQAKVKLNFDINDKVFKDRNGNFRVYPSLFLIYEGSEVIKRYR